MASANITIVGSLGADVELRYTPAGAAVANFNVAVTDRQKENDQWVDGITTWYRVAVWRDYAEHAAESLRKGDQVFVTGRVKNRPYEKDGQTRYSLEIDAEEVGPTLRFATAKVEKVSRGGSTSGNFGAASKPAAADPWGSAPTATGSFGGNNDMSAPF